MVEVQRSVSRSDRAEVDGAHVARVFEQTLAGQDAMFQLIEAICAYAASCRDARVPPEKMVVGIKQALGFHRFGHNGAKTEHAGLAERAITECIRQYYADQGSSPVGH